MAELFANNFSTTLASDITSDATSLTLTSATGAPTLAGSDYFHLTIGSEIVKVTARVGAVCTVTRGEQGTTAAAHSAGASVENRLTRGSLEALQVSGLLHQKTVTLDNDQIKALPTTPVTLCSTSPSSTVIIPRSVNGIVNCSAGAYTKHGNTQIKITPGASLERWVYDGTLANLDFAGTSLWSPAIQDLTSDLSSFVANSLVLAMDGSDLTDGDPANTLVVTICYLVLDLTTGEFEPAPAVQASVLTGLLHQRTVTLTNDQIKALPSQGAQLVTAPGANRIIVPVASLLVLDTTAGLYDEDPYRSWQLAHGALSEASGLVTPDGYLSVSSGIQVFSFPLPFASVLGGTFLGYVGTSGRSLSEVHNQPLLIKDIYNGVSDYTGGHADNTLKVTVTYLILNLTTGEFEPAPVVTVVPETVVNTLTHQASVTLTDDQIKALQHAPIEIVPTPGTAKLLFPTEVILYPHFTGGTYGNLDDYAFLACDPDVLQVIQNTADLTPLTELTKFFNNDGLIWVLAQQQLDYGSRGNSVFPHRWRGDSAELPLLIYGDNGVTATDWTGGHPDNTLDVCTEFRVFDLTLKKFLTVAESGWNQELGIFE